MTNSMAIGIRQEQSDDDVDYTLPSTVGLLLACDPNRGLT